MSDKGTGDSPISDEQFSQALDNLLNRMRKKHFRKMLLKGIPTCVKCGEPIFDSQKFCSYCGNQNPNYDEAQFELEHRDTVANIRASEGCPDSHADLREGLANDQELGHRRGAMYCSECGALVDINK